MKLILCMLVDEDGSIKYAPHYFKSQEADACVTSYKTKHINKNTIFYNTDLDLQEDIGEACWTSNEVKRRLDELKANEVKVFTLLEDFYDIANEIQFAYSNVKFDEYDEKIDINVFKELCNNFDKKFLGASQGLNFFKYNRRD